MIENALRKPPAKRRLRSAQPLTPEQQRLRLKRARVLVQNAADEPSRQFAGKLVNSWRPDDMIAQALADLSSKSARVRREARRFLEVCAPDKLCC